MKKKRCIIIILLLLIAVAAAVFGINGYVCLKGGANIVREADALPSGEYDCILVLGAKVNGDEPSRMLKDRLDKAIELYRMELSPCILMSGDNGTKEYDEVSVMKSYALREGIPEDAVMTDHAGFSTYESMYRAKEIFGAKRILVITQEYHLYRALYIAERLGLEAYGVATPDIAYYGEFYREVREILARDKDFVKCIFMPEPTYLGEGIELYRENK